jgi:methyl-accepting chemotaxis protein
MARLLKLVTHRSISAKLAVMTAASAISMVLLAVTFLLTARAELIAERIQKAHAVVDGVWSMADSFQHAAASGAMTEAEAKTRFAAAADAIWFEDHTNYVFIYDTETGLCVVNGGNPALIGKDMRGRTDSNGLPFAARLLDIARQPGEGTLQYRSARTLAEVPDDVSAPEPVRPTAELNTAKEREAAARKTPDGATTSSTGTKTP